MATSRDALESGDECFSTERFADARSRNRQQVGETRASLDHRRIAGFGIIHMPNDVEQMVRRGSQHADPAMLGVGQLRVEQRRCGALEHVEWIQEVVA